MVSSSVQQGHGDELVLFPGLNAPAPAGSIADAWGYAADATAHDSTCTVRQPSTTSQLGGPSAD